MITDYETKVDVGFAKGTNECLTCKYAPICNQKKEDFVGECPYWKGKET